MSVLRNALREIRAPLTYQAVWGTGRDWEPMTAAGESVTQDTAVHHIAVWACTRLLANAVATLPVRAVVTIGDTSFVPSEQPAWLVSPIPGDMNMTTVEHFSQVMYSLLFDGNAFVAGLPDLTSPTELRVLDPRAVTPKATDRGMQYEVRTGTGVVRYGAETILHIPLIRQPGAARGLSPIEAARLGIGLGMAADRFGASFFSRGATLSGIIQTKSKLQQQEADDLKAKFTEKYSGARKAFDVGILDGGAEWVPLGVSPEQGQFLETRKFQVEEIARLYAVPPALIGMTEPGAVSYSSSETQMAGFLQHSLRPYLVRIEAAYARLVAVPTRITAPGARAKLEFNVDGLLRADFKTRMEGYGSAVDRGIVLRSEVRRRENLPPVDGLDAPLQALNMAVSADVSLAGKLNALSTLVRAGFEPDAAAAFLGLPPIAHTGLVPVTVQPIGGV